MRSAIKRLYIKIINNDILWVLIKPFAKFGFSVYHNRKRQAVGVNQENFPYLYLFNDKKVLYGPFRGMKYPSLSSVGSALYPKLLGCYERELHGVIDSFLSNNYTEIVDIGCAEGYYAVGFGLKLNSVKIHAYDTDETARRLCREMAKLNGIEKRTTIKETCTA